MQLSPLPQTWSEARLLIFGILLGLIPTLVNRWLDRKKSAIEEAEAEARTDLARTNIRSAEFRDFAVVSEGAEKLLSALIQSGDTIHDLQKKIFELEQEKLGDDMLRLDLKKATALLAYNNVRFSEAEHKDVKQMIQILDEIMNSPQGNRARPRLKQSDRE